MRSPLLTAVSGGTIGSRFPTTYKLRPLKLLHVRTVAYQSLVKRPFTYFPGHPHREQWHQIGKRFRQRFHLDCGDRVEAPYTPPPHGTCRVQVVRSVSDWSMGVLTEHSIQNACTSSGVHILLWDDDANDLSRYSTDSRSQPFYIYRWVPVLSSPFGIHGRHVCLVVVTGADNRH